MMYLKFFSNFLNGIVNKMSSLITHQNPRAYKSCNYMFKREVYCIFCIAIFHCFSSSHLVKYFFVVMIYLVPNLLVGGLIGNTKYTGHFSNSLRVTLGLIGISSLMDGFPTL
jgi:hypothetical protein